MRMTFDRYDENGKLVHRCEGVYLVSNNDGKWAIQVFSTIFTPAQDIGVQWPDALAIAFRPRMNHVLGIWDDDGTILPGLAQHNSYPRVSVTGGGVGGDYEQCRQRSDATVRHQRRGDTTADPGECRSSRPTGTRASTAADPNALAVHDGIRCRMDSRRSTGRAWRIDREDARRARLHHNSNKIHIVAVWSDGTQRRGTQRHHTGAGGVL
jgi:hypothetical protein